MFSLHKNLDDSVGLLITPSWLSMVICIAAGSLVVLGILISLHYHGSYTEQFVHQEQSQADATHTNNEHGDTNSVTKEIITDIPLFILWGGVGAIAYTTTMGMIQSFKAGYDLHEELDYVNMNRDDLVKTTIERLVIRAVALLAWFAFVTYSVHVILPYIVSVCSASTAASNWLFVAAYVLLAFVITAFCVHIHAILLRLVALRPRLFGNA